MIDGDRQPPAPCGLGWLFDLTDIRGPIFAVLRAHEANARDTLAEHLVEAGLLAGADEGEQLIGDHLPEVVAVIW